MSPTSTTSSTSIPKDKQVLVNDQAPLFVGELDRGVRCQSQEDVSVPGAVEV